MGKVYDQVCMFKSKYPGTITWWRLRKHSKVVEDHLGNDEEPLYSFAGQKTSDIFDVFSTSVLTVTNRRILIGQDHIITGYTLISITPDMFNDLTAYCGILFGRITIDTVKEKVIFSALDKNSLSEIENAITSNMMEQKQKYTLRQNISE